MFCPTLVPSPLFFSCQAAYITSIQSLHQLLSTLVWLPSAFRKMTSLTRWLLVYWYYFKLSFSPFCISFCLYWKHKTYKFQYLFQNVTIFQYHPLLVLFCESYHCWTDASSLLTSQLSVRQRHSSSSLLVQLRFCRSIIIALENILISLYLSSYLGGKFHPPFLTLLSAIFLSVPE